jgi:hypothetical protein
MVVSIHLTKCTKTLTGITVNEKTTYSIYSEHLFYFVQEKETATIVLIIME